MEKANIHSGKYLVSVSVVTYNHVRFLRQCLDGILMQKAPSCVPNGTPRSEWMELLIHDDCSTDGTQDIIREYMKKYPDVIKPIFEMENQYCKGYAGHLNYFNYRRVQGKYTVTCEGDDYWTDPLKLQKQVDFMESHPDYSVCFCDYRNYNIYTNQYLEPEYTRLMRERGDAEGMDLDIDTMFRRWVTMPLTQVHRTVCMDVSLMQTYKYFRDTHEVYHLLKQGKCRLMNFVGAQRNMHEEGMASMISRKKYVDISLLIDKEFYEKETNPYTKSNWVQTLSEGIELYAHIDKKKALRLSMDLFFVNHKIKRLMKNIVLVIKSK